MTLEVEAARGEPARNRLRLLGFVALMLGSGLALGALAGGPRLPDRVPTAEQITGLLSHASLPPDGAAFVLASAAWLLWLWVFGSLAIELGLVALEAAAHGAAWVGRVREVTRWFTLPLARRMVAAAFAVQVLTRAMPVAAAPLPLAEQVLALEPEDRADIVEHERANLSTYVVRPGDTLWTIAAQFYGSGDEYRRLVDANVGRRMSGGAAFTPQGIIQPGWVLEVPGPRVLIEQEGDARWYTVRPGDTLSTIATRTLGERDRWAEVFELNRDTARLPNGPALDDPDLIWPGLRLRLPDEDPPTRAQPAESHDDDDVVFITAAVAPPELAPTPTPPTAPKDAEAATSGSAEAPSADDDPLDPSLPPLVRDVHPLVRIPADQADDDVPPVDDPAPPVTAPAQVDVEARAPQLPVDASQVPVNAVLGALGAAAAAGLATLGATRLRRWRPLPSAPESEVKVDGGYAEAPLEGELARRLGGGGQVNGATALVSQFLKIVDEYNLAEVQPIFVRHGRSSTTLTLAAGLAEQAILLDLAPVFGERLQVDCSAWVSIDQDVQACLTPLRKTRALQPADVARGPAPWFVPMGVLFDRQLFSANWGALGHVLVVSLPGHGAQTILTSLLAETTARHSPEELRVWLVDRGRGLPPAMTELPHLDTIVDPDVDTALSGLVARLRAELEQRAEGGTWPELAIVVPELTCLGEAAAEVQLLASGASRIGVRLIAASSDPAAATLSPLLSSFTTKMVLHLEEEEHSVALLGSADAAFLGGGGRLLVRVEEREPIELYGYQVAPEHIERLVKVMRTAFSSSATLPLDVATVESAADADEPVMPGDELDSCLEAEIGPYDVSGPLLPSSGVASAELVKTESGATQPPGPEPATTDAPATDQPTSESTSSTAAPSDPRPVQLLVTPAAPIHVICFGEPRVLCGEQQVWPRASGGGDHKPWEVLLYLACQSIEGCTRESLGQSLWPDDDGDRDVTHRMRQSRYRIRSAFSSAAGEATEDGIALERNGAFFLDHAVVYSDAQEFLELTRLARIFAGQRLVIPYLERARAVYAADLLSGPGVRRYAWVDDRDESGVTLREHFRRKLQHAVLTLAELYEDAGDVERAADMYRELIDLEPTDERMWRALWRMGGTYKDVLSLRQDEHRLRTILRDMALADGDDPLGDAAEPRAATRRDFERLLAELEALNAAGTPT